MALGPVGAQASMSLTPACSLFGDRLLEWFDSGGRRWFPWRETSDPYGVWIAEMLLQQTTAQLAAAVWPEFLAQFPTVYHLAGGQESELVRLIAPLGLTYRAERILRGAHLILQEHGGKLPSDRSALLALPGVGRYVSSAVLCFGYGQRVGVVDTNVIRVFQRLFQVRSDRSRPHTDPKLWEFADTLVHSVRPREHNWALLDFAALTCSHWAPKCKDCVFLAECLAGLPSVV